MRNLIPLNYNWKFTPVFSLDDAGENHDDAFETVNLPHTNKEIPYNYVNETDCQTVCRYQNTFTIEKSEEGKRIALVFNGAAHYAKVFVNGNSVGEHKGGYTSFELDVTESIRFGEKNSVTVMLDTRERNDIPPFGYVIDYLTYGGLYREVSIKITESVYITDVFIHAEYVLSENPELVIDITFSQPVINGLCRVSIDNLIAETKTGEGTALSFTLSAQDLKRWDIDTPHLYTAEIVLFKKGVQIDNVAERFGVRHAVFKTDGFYLNGKKIPLVGLNRHQSYAYVGYAMPKNQQRFDADFLKKKLSVNIVRTAHYPQSKHFINRCDEIGLLVFTEIPGWQHIGGEQWRQTAIDHTKEMVLQYRNHPSIILWGVRINESPDCDELYSKTNQAARELDPTRQTGGVRCIKHSNLLEDVYTYNDFTHSGGKRVLENPNAVCPKKSAPYLVTEHNGHKFSTKRFDSEAHRKSLALRHCAVLRAGRENNRMSGVIGWCMSDYNTHKDFGSGDCICYHGVTDLFRIPKFAAAVYSSQQDVIPVLEMSSTMQIGDHSSLILGEIVAFSNADCIRVYKNNEFINDFFPDKARYPHFKHPPFFFSDLLGNQLITKEKFKPKTAAMLKDILLTVNRCGENSLPIKQTIKAGFLMLTGHITRRAMEDLYAKYFGNWGAKQFEFRFEALKNGTVIKTIVREPVKKVLIHLTPDTLILKEENTYDVVRVVIEAHDQNGNVLPYYQEAVLLEMSGPAEIIGATVLPLRGGAAAVYVKSIGKSGTAVLSVTDFEGKTQEVAFDCVAHSYITGNC